MQKLYIENGTPMRTCHWVYAHGNLDCGTDIICYPKADKFDFRNDRIESVIAVLPDGKEVQAKLFFWHSAPHSKEWETLMKENPVVNCHGLLVAEDDTSAIADAQMKFDERRWHV